MSGVAMIGRLLKPNSFRRRMVLVVVAVVLATGLNLAIQRRRLRTWVLALQQRGMTPYIVAGASNIDPAVSITNRIRVALSGWKCLLVIDNQNGLHRRAGHVAASRSSILVITWGKDSISLSSSPGEKLWHWVMRLEA